MAFESPTLQEWKRLYAAATAFRALAPWEWLGSDEVFAVQNPEDAQLGFCAILGSLREVFGLVVYPGLDGLALCVKTLTGGLSPRDEDAAYVQHSFTAFFGPKSELESEDKAVLKKLGLSFVGMRAYPVFRSSLPEFAPWVLTAYEARFMATCLEQATDVAGRSQEVEDLIWRQGAPRDEYLVRVPVREKDTWVWCDERRMIEPTPRPPLAAAPFDENAIAKIKAKNLPTEGIWESDCFFGGMVIREENEAGGRPFFPRVCMFVDHHSGMILGSELSLPGRVSESLQKAFLSAAENANVLPREVWVASGDAENLLTVLVEAFGIRLKRTGHLPELRNVRAYMKKGF
jgi:hypothetical protein